MYNQNVLLISREKYNDLGGAKLQLGDIVYCLRGTLGKNAYIDNFSEGTVASSLVVIRPKSEAPRQELQQVAGRQKEALPPGADMRGH